MVKRIVKILLNVKFPIVFMNQDTMEEWMKLLACSSHDYMKLMVYELQQKLAELDAIDVSSNRTCDFTERISR